MNISTDDNIRVANMVRTIQRAFLRARNWIVYANLFLVAALLYLGDYLGPVREVLLPAAIVGTLAIVFETLSSLESSAFRDQRREFHTLTEAVPLISELVAVARDRTTIHMIAGPGGTTFSSIIPTIVSSCRSKSIHIEVYLVNVDGPLVQFLPPHWRNEVSLTLERMRAQLNDSRVTLNVHLYDSIPVWRGIMIDRKHLILGFFHWVDTSEGCVLTGAERPHIYCNRGHRDDDFLLDAFENWAKSCPGEIGYAYPPLKPHSD